MRVRVLVLLLVRQPNFFRQQARLALRELVSGFDAANIRLDGAILRDHEGDFRQAIHDGLVAVVLRIVVALHAEARDLVGAGGGDSTSARPIMELFEELEQRRLRSGDDALEKARGAWPWLLAIFQQIHQGLYATDECPPRDDAGGLFDPKAHPFLEGRRRDGTPLSADMAGPPPLDDRTVLRVLSSLILDGTTLLRYEELDVEHIGSAHEGLMGFTLEITANRSIEHGSLYLKPDEARRRAGSYYTPPELTRAVVDRTLAPLLRRGDREASPEEILSFAICDPAMGTGAFLVETCRQLAAALEAACLRDGATLASTSSSSSSKAKASAIAIVAERCIYGVDRNPLAVELAKLSLWITARSRNLSISRFDGRLVCGDSLLGARQDDLHHFPIEAFQRDGATPEETAHIKVLYRKLRARARQKKSVEPHDIPVFNDESAGKRALSAWLALWFWPSKMGSAPAPTPETLGEFLCEAARETSEDPRVITARNIAIERRFYHFEAALPAVFTREGPGFDAIVGNPPWVAYAGRAAQPIEPSVFNVYLRRGPAFRGYRSLHGVFVHRCASLLRSGGRLGLVLPTSVSDLDGYEAVRRAHDALCIITEELPDFGSAAFEGVFQPAMALLSTRRDDTITTTIEKAPAWPLARSDLDAEARQLLSRLAALPSLPASLFGERGFQTNLGDAAHVHPIGDKLGASAIAIREGTDIGEFIARPPRHAIDIAAIQGRFRSEAEWQRVRLFIRQTARYPIAALADGLPFRNSILAAFDGEGWTDVALLCYLNSSPIRWFHYVRNRDARQGMPQVKIAHLRALPSPAPRTPSLVAALTALGEPRLRSNEGISALDRASIEEIVADALEMTAGERCLVAAWARATPIPAYSG